jgi:hypothetical protein
MSSKRSRSRVAHDHLNGVEKCLASHRYAAAKRLLESVKLEVGGLRKNLNSRDVGYRYDQLFERHRVESPKPCECLFCGFTAEQKQMAKEDAVFLFQRFERRYPGHPENNMTGAYAEAICGVKFHRPINRSDGPDGGVDFRFPCERMPSGILTMDVKGTIRGDQFRLSEGFISSAEHAYVLIQVVDRLHAHFWGFAFGNEFEFHRKQFPEDQPGYQSVKRRTLAELLVLVPDQEPTNASDDVEVRTP